MRRNNKGFSLVELLVSFAILGIVTAIISAVVVSGTNLYNSNKRVTDLQYKSQVVSAQLHSFIQDCDGGVAVTADGDLYLATTETEFISGSQDGSGTIYTVTKGDGSDATPDEDKLYLREIPITITTGSDGSAEVTPETITLTDYAAQPMCSELDDWSLGVGAADSVAKHITIELSFKEGKSSYTKNISEAFRSKPVYLTQDQAADGVSLVDTLKQKVWG